MYFEIKTAAGIIGATGQALIDLDADKVGYEDFVGALLVYGAEVMSAAADQEDLPPFPDALRTGLTERIPGGIRATLTVTNTTLTFLRFNAKGKAATALRYITQTISQLIGGVPVPPVPAATLNSLK